MSNGGRPRSADMREVVNAILYMAEGGITWRMLPSEFPPLSTVQRYFYGWRNDGTWALINYALVQAGRELEGKEPCPSACINAPARGSGGAGDWQRIGRKQSIAQQHGRSSPTSVFLFAGLQKIVIFEILSSQTLTAVR